MISASSAFVVWFTTPSSSPVDGIGDDLVLIRLSADQCAIKRFDSLGFRKGRMQRAGDIKRDVVAADRRGVGVKERPSANMAMVVVPPPMSMQVTPRRRSSSVVAASALASGAGMRLETAR